MVFAAIRFAGSGQESEGCRMNIRRKSWTRTIGERLEVSHTKDPMSGCWLWEGTLRNGYGVMRTHPGKSYAHRLAYETYVGPIPDGLEVCHRCDVKCCINPSHLFIGTHHDNMIDAWRKGIVKQPPIQTGVNHHQAKLSEDNVRLIRKQAASGKTQRELAAQFKITQSSVWAIVKLQTWRHI
jgi:hypothetical protein